MEAKNVDDMLISEMQAHHEKEPTQPVVSNPIEVEQPVEVEHVDEKPAVEAKVEPEKVEEVKADDKTIDEYGNPIEKPKMYTEEDLNRLVRERLARGRQQEVNTPPPTQQQQRNDNVANDNGDQDWEQQLDAVIDRRIETKQKLHAEQQWQHKENQRQAEFEDKFTNGMAKYADFKEVVADKPITDTMLLATRNLDNPAAFLYGAAKLHPKEIERISQIADPFAQASEVGRLHERMVKERKGTSSASRPLEAPKSDMGHTPSPNAISIDQRIQSYARNKRK